MYESKNLKNSEGTVRVSTGYKSAQRKEHPVKLIHPAVKSTILVDGATQLKKLEGNKQLQREADPEKDEEGEPLQMKRENNTGMPDQLKAGIENLSRIDMSSVRVHYNSDKPAGVGALAYTQGTDIHVASGQEKYLPHEAWHVVQQAQGRVQPTMQMQGVQVNDDPGLEHEADVMGERAHNYRL